MSCVWYTYRNPSHIVGDYLILANWTKYYFSTVNADMLHCLHVLYVFRELSFRAKFHINKGHNRKRQESTVASRNS